MLKYAIRRTIITLYVLFFCAGFAVFAQSEHVPQLWHNKTRTINYQPDGGDIVIENGKHRFNRALYGGNTAFRVEAGDLPEFAMYLPGMGGNLRFGFVSGTKSKWLIDAEKIEARYRAGSMIYTVEDSMLGEGVLTITVLAGANKENLIVSATTNNLKAPVSLFWAFGGATGKKFSRDGDLGADPESSFYLKPEYCKDNSFKIENNTFLLSFAGKSTNEADRYEIKQPGATQNTILTVQQKQITGIFPPGADLHTADANKQASPHQLLQSKATDAPLLTGQVKIYNARPLYFYIQNGADDPVKDYKTLPLIFTAAEAARAKLFNRIKVNTPDAYINTLGGVLAVAADAIWESPSYMHGAIAWRMRLNAWRGPYVADVLGWHDRARSHFSSYAKSQMTIPEGGPVIPDSALHDARQLEKLGTAMFSSGYVSRNPDGKIVPHHYDMNLVYIDALLNHFQWTGDIAFIKQMWPVLTRHLAWEKRNFDADGDGLYDAYCAIWASDALQYSGGGVTHSSAYNYRANKMAAQIAKLIGENPQPYQQEADHILKAINKTLWLPKTGQYAEYQDLLGEKMIHPSAALWTVYHAIDEGVPDAFQTYQALRYIDTKIPHTPIVAKGVPAGLYTLSTTNWMPYTWSINNVVLAEELHTALAYWQGGRNEEAFKLWKGSLMESMFLESSPGNFENMSFYDVNRGELYRDFGDPIGMAGRSLVEGLFGIHPDALKDTLTIKPGFPAEWDHASLKTPDIKFDFSDKANASSYQIIPAFSKSMNLVLELNARAASIKSVLVNGHAIKWTTTDVVNDMPTLKLDCGKAPRYQIKIVWGDEMITHKAGFTLYPPLSSQGTGHVFDPQNILPNMLTGDAGNYGSHTLFVKNKQGSFKWWSAINMDNRPTIEITTADNQPLDALRFTIKANKIDAKATVTINPGLRQLVSTVNLKVDAAPTEFVVPATHLLPGSNVIQVEVAGKLFQQNIVSWNITEAPSPKLDTINLTPYFNDQVTNIFKNKYLSPRPTSPTLQLPWQGIGNWCYPLVDANIDDSGLRKAAGSANLFTLPQQISFATPGQAGQKNIVFTSQWDNYPKQVIIPLSGKSSHAYLLMAGSTNPMQSRITNGQVIVTYTDGSAAILDLKNPETWWPIEQDYEDDGYAFQLNAARPIRVYLKTGKSGTETLTKYTSIKGYSNRAIDGGAATVLDLPLDGTKELKTLSLKTLANDVVIGLMGLTLVRE